MARRALVDASGRVVNVISIEPGALYEAPSGHRLLRDADCERAGIGDKWDGSSFVAPGSVPAPADPLAVCYEYVVSDRLDSYLAADSPTAAAAASALKDTIRTLRSLIRALRELPEAKR